MCGVKKNERLYSQDSEADCSTRRFETAPRRRQIAKLLFSNAAPLTLRGYFKVPARFPFPSPFVFPYSPFPARYTYTVHRDATRRIADCVPRDDDGSRKLSGIVQRRETQTTQTTANTMVQMATSRDSFRDLGRDRRGKRACRIEEREILQAMLIVSTMPIRRRVAALSSRMFLYSVHKTISTSYTSKMIILRKV